MCVTANLADQGVRCLDGRGPSDLFAARTQNGRGENTDDRGPGCAGAHPPES